MSRYDAPIDRLRTAAQPARPAPGSMAPYLHEVRHGAYRITAADVEALTAAGLSDDEIFEQTVAAAVAAGLERLDAGLRVLG